MSMPPILPQSPSPQAPPPGIQPDADFHPTKPNLPDLPIVMLPEIPGLIAEPFFEKQIISTIALELSRTRKAQTILLRYGGNLDRFFDSIPSTSLECAADWRNAIAAFAIDGLTGKSKLHLLASACFSHFEGLTLEDLRQSVAYRLWLASTGDQHAESTRIRCYLEGCDELRIQLAAPRKSPGPQGAVQYLLDTYLNPQGMADPEKTASLIELKAQRLDGCVPNPTAAAERFVHGFYGNVHKAITERGQKAVTQVLKAAQYGGSYRGQPPILNAYETLLLILFLDGKMVSDLWADPDSGIKREATL